MNLLTAIAAYERQREQIEGWSAFLRAVEQVEPEFYAALVKRWPVWPKRGRRAA